MSSLTVAIDWASKGLTLLVLLLAILYAAWQCLEGISSDFKDVRLMAYIRQKRAKEAAQPAPAETAPKHCPRCEEPCPTACDDERCPMVEQAPQGAPPLPFEQQPSVTATTGVLYGSRR